MSSEDIGTLKNETESLTENQNSELFSKVKREDEIIIKNEPIESTLSKNVSSTVKPIYVLSSEIELKEELNETQTQNEEKIGKNVPKIEFIFAGSSKTVESKAPSVETLYVVKDQSESKIYKESETIKTIYRESLGMLRLVHKN